ncbi:HNH endonuclease [Stenotrophomonas sp.]|uniref:HNH endonuclease n=1 Tax=Stenotrophomonas sp. TaxID=69392 RepID=UPI0028AA3B12|nr:HNH endonuclease [Stenotrophomonas sp.]
MAAPDFSKDVIETLAFRSGLICNNPSCQTITTGPSDGKGALKLKIGEAAHISSKRKGQARYDDLMSDEARAKVENGIWLCASCHTLVDKNKGVDFPAVKLVEWKRSHEDLIRSLLHSHRSPVPLLRRFTEEGQVAQDIIDLLEGHGALFVDHHLEVSQHVSLSIERLRQDLSELRVKIRYDSKLKALIKDLVNECREYMNRTSRYSSTQRQELDALRSRIGHKVLSLRDDYGCNVRGQLNTILPR